MGLAVFLLFIACGIYVQYRGVVQHEKFNRKLTDHSNIFGPINGLFYSFSKAPNSHYLNVENFPQLQILQDNWQLIKSSDKLDDIGFNSFYAWLTPNFFLRECFQ